MVRIQNSILIKRPIEEAFAYLSDIRNTKEYQEGVISVGLTSPEPQGAGTTFQFKIKVMGMTIETRGEITGFEPLRRFAWKSTSGPFPMQGFTLFESADGGTLVTDEIEAEPGGFFKLAEGLLVKQQQGQIAADMQRAKDILEKHSTRERSMS